MKPGRVTGFALMITIAAGMTVLALRWSGGRRSETPAAQSARPERPGKTEPDTETVRGEVEETANGGRGDGDGKGGGAEAPAAPVITVRTDTETILVHAGPPRFHEEIGLTLVPGDRIEVTGKRQGKPGQATLLAQTIKKDDRVFRVRDEKGERLWRPKRESELALSAIAGEVVDLAPETADRAPGREQSGMFITVKTDQGRIAVQLGPEPFRTRQGFTIEMGDRVEISGWRLPGAHLLHEPLMIAATIQKGGRVLQLRDRNRRALWTEEKATGSK
jgi:hypothetical protein